MPGALAQSPGQACRRQRLVLPALSSAARSGEAQPCPQHLTAVSRGPASRAHCCPRPVLLFQKLAYAITPEQERELVDSGEVRQFRVSADRPAALRREDSGLTQAPRPWAPAGHRAALGKAGECLCACPRGRLGPPSGDP